MRFNAPRLACVALLGAAMTAPSLAESIASSASSAGSASLGSLSESIHGSSNSSSGKKEVAEGEYRILEVAELAGRPGMLRLTLAAAARPGAEGEVVLDLPQAALARRGLSRGDLVSARHRPYGLEFAHADTREAFFLVLDDGWRRDLDPHAVTL